MSSFTLRRASRQRLRSRSSLAWTLLLFIFSLSAASAGCGPFFMRGAGLLAPPWQALALNGIKCSGDRCT